LHHKVQFNHVLEIFRIWFGNSRHLILMFTKEIEDGKIKCDRYWPEKGDSFTFDVLEVALIEENVHQDITKRIFTLTDTMSNESRTITQLQYLDWPDHGVPHDTASFLKIVKTASEVSLPIIVHCSAGIGRTGSFCTVHSILEKLKYDMKQDPKKEHVINVPKVLQELKKTENWNG